MPEYATWFTSDHHFGHANIIRFCERPFNTVDEMDSELIYRWNEAVGRNDVVYHLGDFALMGLDFARRIFRKLNGRIAVVPGGHDKRWLPKSKHNVVSKSGHWISVLPPLVSVTFDKRIIVLCHYAMRVWDRSHYGAWHLYGHSHGKLPEWGNALDVGVDSHDFTPISLEEISVML